MYGHVFTSMSQTRRSSSRIKSKPTISNLKPGRFLGSREFMAARWQSIIRSLILCIMWSLFKSGYFLPNC